MTKKIVFQVNIDNGSNDNHKHRKKFVYSGDMFAHSNKLAAEYAERIGADYFCLRSSNCPGLPDNDPPAYYKLYMYELFAQGYEQVLFLDSDAFVYADCPDIFQLKGCAATVDQPDPQDNVRRCEKLGFRSDFPYFCSGVALFDKAFYDATKDRWHDAYMKYRHDPQAQHDQTILNYLVHEYVPTAEYTTLSPEWGAWWKRSARFILHLNGPSAKLNFNQQKLDAEMLKRMQKSANNCLLC